MAKKSVGIVEQHVEKVVLGVAVLFLLVVVALYLVRNPNRVEFDGQAYYPAQIDLAVRDRAERLARALQRPRPIAKDRLSAPDWRERLDAAFEKGPIEVNDLDKTIMAVVPWGPKVPVIKVQRATEVRGRLALAQIEAPAPPKVRYTRTLAVPPREPSGPGRDPDRAAVDEVVIEEDINLVIIESEFDLARQKELLTDTYGYDPEFTNIIFAAVQVQRQERLGPEWGDWEDVLTFTESPPPSPPSMKLVGENALSQQSIGEFREYRDQLTGPKAQSDLLTPPGPTRRSGARAYAAQPKDARPTGRPRTRERPSERRGGPTIAGLRPDLRVRRDTTGYGDYRAGRRAGPSERRSKPADDSSKSKKPKKLRFSSDEEAAEFIAKRLAEAEQALKDKQYEDAKALAQKVLDAHDATKAGTVRQVERASKIVGGGEPGQLKGRALAGERFQPIRAFDVGGEPGRTYRYRLRVGVLNEYCLAGGKLKDPKDAAKPIIYGKWSAASEPVSIERDTYFYLVSWNARDRGVRIDVFKWYQDGWIKEQFTVQPGQEIGAKRDVQVKIAGGLYREELDFFTGAVAVDMGSDVPYQPVKSQGDGYVLDPRRSLTTQSLVYMDEDGELRERFAFVDKADPRYKDLVAATMVPRAKPVKVERRKTTGRQSSAKDRRRHAGSFKKYRSGSRSRGYGKSRRYGRSGRGSYGGSRGRIQRGRY